MTNYIEEMMRTAGVEPHCQTEDGTGCKYCQKDYSCKLHRNRADCSYILDGWDFNFYPNFTAEKQLEIIKLIAKKGFFFDEKIGWGLFVMPNITIDQFIDKLTSDFTQALAQLTTELMKAGELDKEKVKGILEG